MADHAARLFEVTDLTLKQTTALIAGPELGSGGSVPAPLAAAPCHPGRLAVSRRCLAQRSEGRLRLTSAQFPDTGIELWPDAMSSWRRCIGSGSVRRRADPRARHEGSDLHGQPAPAGHPTGRSEGSPRSPWPCPTSTITGPSCAAAGSRVVSCALGRGVIAQYPPPPDGLSFAPIDKSAFDAALRSSAQSGLSPSSAMGSERIGSLPPGRRHAALRQRQHARGCLLDALVRPDAALWRLRADRSPGPSGADARSPPSSSGSRPRMLPFWRSRWPCAPGAAVRDPGARDPQPDRRHPRGRTRPRSRGRERHRCWRRADRGPGRSFVLWRRSVGRSIPANFAVRVPRRSFASLSTSGAIFAPAFGGQDGPLRTTLPSTGL